jgi:hypothetical protein
MQSVRYFCPILTIFGVYGLIFVKVPSTQFRGNRSIGYRADTCRRTDMTKLMGAFRDYANASKINYVPHREHCIPYKGKSVNNVQSLFVLMILEIA